MSERAAIILCLCLWSTPAVADELFVGGPDEHPTIGAALGVAVEGDVVTIRAGRYEEVDLHVPEDE